MKAFEFKSQICTSIEQSKRLLALGLKKETADMSYIPTVVNHKVEYRLDCSTPKSIDIPAWSLHRLILISGVPAFGFFRMTTWDEVVNWLCGLIKEGVINKDYLEEKQ